MPELFHFLQETGEVDDRGDAPRLQHGDRHDPGGRPQPGSPRFSASSAPWGRRAGSSAPSSRAAPAWPTIWGPIRPSPLPPTEEDSKIQNPKSKIAKLAILLSGRGSNFLAIHAAIERGEIPAEIVLVASNVADAAGLAKARELGLPAVAIPHRGEPGRQAHEEKVIAALRRGGRRVGLPRRLHAAALPGACGELPAADRQHPSEPAPRLPRPGRAGAGARPRRQGLGLHRPSGGRGARQRADRGAARRPRARRRYAGDAVGAHPARPSTRPTPRRCGGC